MSRCWSSEVLGNSNKKTLILCFSGCETFFDGLVCWPSTDAGQEATVDCFTIEAFAKAIKYTLTAVSVAEEGIIFRYTCHMLHVTMLHVCTCTYL